MMKKLSAKRTFNFTGGRLNFTLNIFSGQNLVYPAPSETNFKF